MSREYHLLRKYGIDNEQYECILNNQERSCAICKRQADSFPYRLAVDHDHITGEIRGLLCTYCNRYRVGRSRKEHLGLLQAVITYLDRDYTGWIVPPKRKRKKKHGKRKRKR